MTTNADMMQRLKEVDAVITDSHVVYTSGRHGRAYINKDAIYVHTGLISELCKQMASQYDADKVDVVAGPTIGGVVLSQWVAEHLNRARQSGETVSVYAEEEVSGSEKKRVFKRGYSDYIAGKNIVVVEDVMTTGGSALKVIDEILRLGGNILGLSVLCNRGGIKPEDLRNVPIHALTEISLDSWEAGECPMCKEGVPINTRVGKGREYLARLSAARSE